jgi:predicted AAA+ superfamily ATPase
LFQLLAILLWAMQQEKCPMSKYDPWTIADISGVMENLVYVELRRRGYRVSVGQWGTQEIDFVAEKNGKPHYFQVTLHLDAKTVIARETTPLLAIGDNHPKTIITLDSVHADSIEGINISSLKDFLSEKT